MTDGAQPGAPTATSVLEALGLPAAALVQQRVPKKLLLDNVAITAGDKRVITEGIDEIHWLASLKPSTVGVPTFVDVGLGTVSKLLLQVSSDHIALADLIGNLPQQGCEHPTSEPSSHRKSPSISTKCTNFGTFPG